MHAVNSNSELKCQLLKKSKCKKGTITHLPRCSVYLEPRYLEVMLHLDKKITMSYMRNRRLPSYVKYPISEIALDTLSSRNTIKNIITKLSEMRWIGIKVSKGAKLKIYPNYTQWEDWQKAKVISGRSGFISIPISLLDIYRGNPVGLKVMVSRISNSNEYNASLSTGREAKLLGLSHRSIQKENINAIDLGLINQTTRKYKSMFHLRAAEVRRYSIELLKRGVLPVSKKHDDYDFQWDNLLENEQEYLSLSNIEQYCNYSENNKPAQLVPSKPAQLVPIQVIPLRTTQLISDKSDSSIVRKSLSLRKNGVVSQGKEKSNFKNNSSSSIPLPTDKPHPSIKNNKLLDFMDNNCPKKEKSNFKNNSSSSIPLPDGKFRSSNSTTTIIKNNKLLDFIAASCGKYIYLTDKQKARMVKE